MLNVIKNINVTHERIHLNDIVHNTANTTVK